VAPGCGMQGAHGTSGGAGAVIVKY
jgi:hypothetical protein